MSCPPLRSFPSSSPSTTGGTTCDLRSRASFVKACQTSSSSSSMTDQTDSTPAVLAGLDDPRVRVVQNDERRGLAGALNRGLDVVQGRHVARMDADDIALPHWLERVLGRLVSEPAVSLVGAGVLEFSDGRLGAIHLPEPGPAVTRWYSLFSSSPFFHNTVAFDEALRATPPPLRRDVRRERGLRATGTACWRARGRLPGGSPCPLPASRRGLAQDVDGAAAAGTGCVVLLPPR